MLLVVRDAPTLSVRDWLALPLEQQRGRPLVFKKIDAGFAMPEANSELKNDLATLPQASQPLTRATRALLMAQSEPDAVALVQARLTRLGLYPDGASAAGEAYAARMQRIRDLLVAHSCLSVRAINDALMAAQPPLREPPELARIAPGEAP
jgi:hypothetical protein